MFLVGWHLLHQIIQPFKRESPVCVDRTKLSHEVAQVKGKMMIRFD